MYNDLKVVAIGGGTGLSQLLRGLKYFTSNITAVVNMSDDGGGSGKLRKDMGILPPGDIRSCLLALANIEGTMRKLIEYRFKDGELKGQNFGNLLIAALTDIYGSFDNAIKEASNVLNITGEVLPITLDDVILFGLLENGSIVSGESKIAKEVIKQNSRIKRVYTKPEKYKILDKVLDSVEDSDIIVIGPGSLYTSIIPNLLNNDFINTLKKSKSKVVYICNIMTEVGETSSYNLLDHIEAINNHTEINFIDYLLYNTGKLPNKIEEIYHDKNQEIIKYDDEQINKIKKYGINPIGGDFIHVEENLVFHDSIQLSRKIINIYNNI